MRSSSLTLQTHCVCPDVHVSQDDESCLCCRDEAQHLQEEQQFYKLHQKQMEAQQDSAWMHSVPDWHDAELEGQNKPWTVPSQLLTAEEEVRMMQFMSHRESYLRQNHRLWLQPKPNSALSAALCDVLTDWAILSSSNVRVMSCIAYACTASCCWVVQVNCTDQHALLYI